MPITAPKTDAAISDLMVNGLASRAGSPKRREPLGGDLRLAPPLYVYSLKIRDLRLPDYLSRAVHSGWVGLAIGHSAPIAARVHDVATPRFTGLQFGWAAKQLLDAIEVAEVTLETNPAEFEIRLLEIPALHLTFLWLHADHDHDLFVAIGGGSDLDHGDPALVAEIDSFVKIALERRDLNLAARRKPITRDKGGRVRGRTIALAAISIIVLVAVVFWAIANA